MPGTRIIKPLMLPVTEIILTLFTLGIIRKEANRQWTGWKRRRNTAIFGIYPCQSRDRSRGIGTGINAAQRSKKVSGQIEAIEVHHLAPRRHEVFHKLLLRVVACIDFRNGTKLGVRTEEQIDPGAGPLDSPVLRSIPSKRLRMRRGCHSVLMSSRLTKKSLVSVPAGW